MADKKAPTLADLIPQPRALPLGEVTLMVAPMGWERGCEALDALGPALQHMPPLGELKALGERAADWVAFVSTFREEIAEFTAIAAGDDAETIKALPPTTMLELLLGVLEVNADFFGRSLPGVLERLAGRLVALQAQLVPAAEAAARAAASTTSSSA